MWKVRKGGCHSYIWKWMRNRHWPQTRKVTLVISRNEKATISNLPRLLGAKGQAFPPSFCTWMSVPHKILALLLLFLENKCFLPRFPLPINICAQDSESLDTLLWIVQVWDLDFVISSPSFWSLQSLLSYDTNFHWPRGCLDDPVPCLSLLPRFPCCQGVALCKCSLFSLQSLPRPT